MMRIWLLARAVAIALLLAALMPGWEVTMVQGGTPVAEAESVYVDPAGRFRLPLPTRWSAETEGDVGVITSPEGGITVFALVMPGSDIPDALDSAWRVADPEFGLVAGEPLETPSIAGLRPFTLVEYRGAPAGKTV